LYRVFDTTARVSSSSVRIAAVVARVADLREDRVAAGAAGRVHLDHLAAGHVPDDVEVVHAAVAEDPAGPGQVARRRRRRVHGRRPHGVQPAELAAEDGVPGGDEAGVEAPVVADLHRGAGAVPQHLGRLLAPRATGFSQKTGQARLDGGEDELRMRVGGGGDDHAVDAAGEQFGGIGGRLGAVFAAIRSVTAGTASVTTSSVTVGQPASVSAWNAPIRPSPMSPIRMPAPPPVAGTPSVTP
jgi:hypothetical protein